MLGTEELINRQAESSSQVHEEVEIDYSDTSVTFGIQLLQMLFDY